MKLRRRLHTEATEPREVIQAPRSIGQQSTCVIERADFDPVGDFPSAEFSFLEDVDPGEKDAER
jgi:hypothetical protein